MDTYRKVNWIWSKSLFEIPISIESNGEMKLLKTSENIPEIKIIEHFVETETVMSYNIDISLPELVKNVSRVHCDKVGR